MLRLTVQRKVFLAIFALTTTLVVVLALAMRWNIGQGFERYTSAAEFARLDWLIKNIESEYAVHGNWEFLRPDPEQTWRRLSRPNPRGGYGSQQGESKFGPRDDASGPQAYEIRHSPSRQDDRPPRPDDADMSLSPRMQDARRPPPGDAGIPRAEPPDARMPPANDPLRIGPRLALLDADGNRLAGQSSGKEIGSERSIMHQGKAVGRLVLQAAPSSVDQLDAAFLASQTKNMLLAVLAALTLSLLAAWALARHLLAPIQDVTDGARRIAEGRLEARIPVGRNDELGELAGSFNMMAERLAKVEVSRRAWISDTSHELRTPLAVLRAEIEAIQDGVRSADSATLARLHKQVQQLATLVDDLRLTLDREPGVGDMEHLLFSPLATLAEAVAAFRERYADANISIEISGQTGGNRQMRGDAGRLTQVFNNLLENTLRYTDAGGKLRIATRTDSQRLFIQLDDTAPAPPRSALPRLFERFFRAEPSRSRASGGSGLGLAICKTLVEAHGGCISASLSDLGGLCLRIELPLEKT